MLGHFRKGPRLSRVDKIGKGQVMCVGCVCTCVRERERVGEWRLPYKAGRCLAMKRNNQANASSQLLTRLCVKGQLAKGIVTFN
jgi:hypothetical protein